MGRPRDTALDERLLEVASRHLAAEGFRALSLAAVAEEAGTTRQALYRRWATKGALAAAVVARAADRDVETVARDPFAGLVAELADFQRGISTPGRLLLAGTMLQETTDEEVRRRYQQRVVVPRRRRIRAILERGIEAGLLDAEADLEVAVTMATGNWYGRALAGEPVPERWPRRSAALVWRALGGAPPPDEDRSR